MFGMNTILDILYTVPGIIIGFAFHEFAHAYVSDRLGDPTPRNLGRLTISPLSHIDPIGFILILIAGFGWARPVPVNSRYYKNPRRDEILVSLAGPGMNLLLAIVFSVLLKVLTVYGLYSMNNSDIIYNLFMSTIWINIVLFVFNLIPLPPLDGYHILINIIPTTNYKLFYYLEQYSTIILILLIISRAASVIIGIPARLLLVLITGTFGL
jgi:Zn-dependent protease